MTKPRLLVADPEYIIAMEAERILHDLMDCEVTIINPHSSADRLALDWSTYRLAMIDTGVCLGEIRVIAELLQRERVAVVFTTAHQAYTGGVPGFPETPVIAKPYGPEQFAEVILPLLASAEAEAVTGRSVGR